jgi:hypothetical protein
VDFYIRKIQRLRPGLNPRTREPEASMPKPSGFKFAFLFQNDDDGDDYSPRSFRRRSTKRRSSARGSVSGSLRKDGTLRNSFTSEDYRATLRRSIMKKHTRQPSLISITTNVSTESVFWHPSPNNFVLTITYYFVVCLKTPYRIMKSTLTSGLEITWNEITVVKF